MDITDGSGIYRREAILGLVDEPVPNKELFTPQIEEIRMIRGADGEDYINVKDMTMAMKQVAFKMPLPTLSVLAFIKGFDVSMHCC